MQCEQNTCRPRPKCEMTVYSSADYSGATEVLGPWHYKESAPFTNYTPPKHGSVIGSFALRGGCSTVVLMTMNNFDSLENIVSANWHSNNKKPPASQSAAPDFGVAHRL